MYVSPRAAARYAPGARAARSARSWPGRRGRPGRWRSPARRSRGRGQCLTVARSSPCTHFPLYGDGCTLTGDTGRVACAHGACQSDRHPPTWRATALHRREEVEAMTTLFAATGDGIARIDERDGSWDSTITLQGN